MGEDFFLLDNLTFETMFSALDRDNAQAFSELFTPLAQKNMIDVLTASRYGDDFAFYKRGTSHAILAEHLKDWQFDMSASNFEKHSILELRETYLRLQEAYFDHFYAALLPFLAVPSFHEGYEFSDTTQKGYTNNYSRHAKEICLNSMPDSLLRFDEADTELIVKVQKFGSLTEIDYDCMHISSFKKVPRISSTSIYGDDGVWHRVEVQWFEYVPVSHARMFATRVLDISQRDYEILADSGAFLSTPHGFKDKHAIWLELKDKFEVDHRRIDEIIIWI